MSRAPKLGFGERRRRGFGAAFANERFASAQQSAYNYVREQILSGGYAGGTRLNPADIARTLGVSRMPVREALRQLDAEGFVMMRPNRSATVTKLTPSDVEEVFEMRAVLEALAVRLAVPNVTEDALSELTLLKARMDRARDDPATWLERHDDFHGFMCGLAGRHRLSQEIGRLRQYVQPYLLLLFAAYGDIEMPEAEHDALLAAFASRDAKVAENEMRGHIQEAAARIVSFLRKQDARERSAAPVAQRRM
jgi:DNA-binding GntR family transcriptional regulator